MSDFEVTNYLQSQSTCIMVAWHLDNLFTCTKLNCYDEIPNFDALALNLQDIIDKCLINSRKQKIEYLGQTFGNFHFD
jgi:hypothetical protein